MSRHLHKKSPLFIVSTSVLALAVGFFSATTLFVGFSSQDLAASNISAAGIPIGTGGKYGTLGMEMRGNRIYGSYTLPGADDGTGQPGCGTSSNCLTVPSTSVFKGIATTTSIRDAILKWVNWALGFLALIAMIAIIYSGFLYVTARGEDDQAGHAKKNILYVTLGIIVILLAYAYVATLITTGPTGSDLSASASTSN